MTVIARKAAEHGAEVYGRMLDLEDAHIEDAVRTGMFAAASEALRLADHRGAVDTALRDVLEEAKRRTPQLTGDQLTGDRIAMTIGYVVIDRLRGQ